MAKMLNNSHTLGTGGSKCPCCGVNPSARSKEKAEWKKDIAKEKEERQKSQ